MRIIRGNLFEPTPDVDAICIPTNGQVRRDGRAVMGAGVAKIARDTFIDIDIILAKCIKDMGNHTHYLGTWNEPIACGVVAFPTKDHWRDDSNPSLIHRSAIQLVQMAVFYDWTQVWLPCVGAGLGGLPWSKVRELLEPILDDRFTTIQRG